LALLVRIHLEAMMRSPRRYLTAAKWRVMGKRVRARAQFAPILMKTSRAYEWWALQRDSAELPSQAGEPVVIGLIEAGARGSALDMTLASLAAEGIPYHVLDPLAANQRRQIVDNIAWGATPWLLPVYAGDSLAPGTIRAYREQIRKADAAVIYADDDTWGRMARPTAPHFKPDWNPELFRHLDYLTGACVIRVDHAMLATALCEADWARALVEEALAGRAPAAHLPMVLHHRAARPAPSLPLSPLPIAPTLPPLTAIIPTRNRVDLLATCLAGLEAADYSEIEAIVVDNDSDDAATLAFLGDLPARSRPGRQFRVLRHPGPFNYSAINNRAVAEATGELICLLNNDIEMRSPDWLKIMATQALRDDVGAVGAQLLYPDGRIQHAGVVIGVGNAAGHAHRFLRPEEEGYFRRHALPQFISAVTAACLVVKRERFLAVGGLDEVSFPVAFNDVDLCLKLNQRGWQSFYEPRAVLIHHESVSRGFDTDPVGAARFAGELAALQQRWQTDTIVDPYHHPQLSRASEQFVIAL
jgi:GT2 family glycosyltransferase